MLELVRIQKHFKDGNERIVALKDISLKINENEFVAIMGRSGSGKSTLMNVLGCLDKPDSGRYLLNNIDTSSLNDFALSGIRNNKIGFVFQSFHLLPKLTVLDNVLLPVRFSGVQKSNAKLRALKLLSKVGLASKIGQKPYELSGGQRQRVAVARALINSPSIILADEPTGNLDTKSSKEIMSLFSELHKAGQTVIIVTHEEQTASYANRIINIKDGEVYDAC